MYEKAVLQNQHWNRIRKRYLRGIFEFTEILRSFRFSVEEREGTSLLTLEFSEKILE